MMAGQYQQAPPLPYTPGMEYSGTVVSSSGNSGVSPGDRVCVADMINAGKSCLKNTFRYRKYRLLLVCSIVECRNTES